MQLVRLGMGAVMLLLVQGLFAPASAWAGCNHLVESRTQSRHAIDRLNLLDIGRFAPDPAHPGGETPAPGLPRPCSGPSCSGRIPLPAPSSSVPKFQGPDQWGILPSLIGLTSSTPRCDLAEESLLTLTVRPSRVFHPPRISG